MKSHPNPHGGGVMMAAKSAALGASLVVRATPAVAYGYTVRLDSTAPSGTYYVQLLDAASLPSNGAVTHIVGPIKVAHTGGFDDVVNFDMPAGVGIQAATGIVIALSTTEFTLTVSSNYLSVIAAVWG